MLGLRGGLALGVGVGMVLVVGVGGRGGEAVRGGLGEGGESERHFDFDFRVGGWRWLSVVVFGLVCLRAKLIERVCFEWV